MKVTYEVATANIIVNQSVEGEATTIIFLLTESFL